MTPPRCPPMPGGNLQHRHQPCAYPPIAYKPIHTPSPTLPPVLPPFHPLGQSHEPSQRTHPVSSPLLVPVPRTHPNPTQPPGKTKTKKPPQQAIIPHPLPIRSVHPLTSHKIKQRPSSSPKNPWPRPGGWAAPCLSSCYGGKGGWLRRERNGGDATPCFFLCVMLCCLKFGKLGWGSGS